MRLKALLAQFSISEQEAVAFFASHREAIEPDADLILSDLQVLLAFSASSGLRSWIAEHQVTVLEAKPPAGYRLLTEGESDLAKEYLVGDEAQLLSSWASFASQKQAIATLHEMLPEECWDYGGTLSTNKHPMLKNYLKFTFMRLVHESSSKIFIKGDYATFNTGLVAKNGKHVFALFQKQQKSSASPGWLWQCFCTERDGLNGEFLHHHFGRLPAPADYNLFPKERIAFGKGNKVLVDWKHIISDHVERLPAYFIRGLLPESVKPKETMSLSKKEQDKYRNDLHHYLARDSDFYLGIRDELKLSVEHSLAALNSNPNLCAKIYYPKLRSMSLLLPLYLTDSPRKSADLALVLTAKSDEVWAAKTIYTPDMAYQNCRLLGKPPVWLNPWEKVDLRRKKQRPINRAPARKVWDLPA